jgi:hypothetical protein
MKAKFFTVKHKALVLVIIFTILALSNLCVYAEPAVALPSINCGDSSVEDFKSVFSNEGWATGLDAIHKTQTLQQNLHAGWFGPSNYEECVEDNIKKVSSEVAARAVLTSCTQLFNNPSLSEGEKKFYNCILKNIKGVSTDIAARVIIQNCGKRFPGK